MAMTITNDQARRIRTFNSAHSQVLDRELLYMVMNNLAIVHVRKQAWTWIAVLSCYLTSEGDQAWREWNEKQAAEDESQREADDNGQPSTLRLNHENR
jgi:hypothetical protein